MRNNLSSVFLFHVSLSHSVISLLVVLLSPSCFSYLSMQLINDRHVCFWSFSVYDLKPNLYFIGFYASTLSIGRLSLTA